MFCEECGKDLADDNGFTIAGGGIRCLTCARTTDIPPFKAKGYRPMDRKSERALWPNLWKQPAQR